MIRQRDIGSLYYVKGSTANPAQSDATLRDAAENLLIAIGMGWDLNGCVENLRAALAQSDAEPPGHTDLMVRPETLDAYMEANPLPADAEPTDDRPLGFRTNDVPDPYAEGPQSDAEKELNDIAVAIGSNRFLDPPDGGSVSLAEQVTRMRQALEKAEAAQSDAGPKETWNKQPPGPDSILHELGDYPDASAEIAELQERCADAQRLAFKWMERHDKVVWFISKNYPSVMMPNLPFPSPVSRPDTSVGLIEAAEMAEECASECLEDRKAPLSAYALRDFAKLLRARAADRSNK